MLRKATEEAIRDLIKKELPAQLGEELQAWLSETRNAMTVNDTLRSEVDRLEADRRKATAKLAEVEARYAEEAKLWGDLNKREKEIRERENQRLVELANLRAEGANERANDIFSLVETVFRSPRLVRRETESTPLEVERYGTKTVEYHAKTKTTEEEVGGKEPKEGAGG